MDEDALTVLDKILDIYTNGSTSTDETRRNSSGVTFEGFMFCCRLIRYHVSSRYAAVFTVLLRSVRLKVSRGLAAQFISPNDRLVRDIHQCLLKMLSTSSNADGDAIDRVDFMKELTEFIKEMESVCNKRESASHDDKSIISISNSKRMKSNDVLHGNADLVPFSRSRIWKLSTEFYKSSGLKAFEGSIPWGVSSNPMIAKHLFSVILARFSEIRDDPERNILVFDFGCGHCFLGYFLANLIRKDIDPAYHRRFKVILTDCHSGIWEQQAQLPGFHTLISAGLLDFCLMELVDGNFCLGNLLVAKKSITEVHPSKCDVVVFANYFFDSLPHDVMRFKDDSLQIAMVDSGKCGSLARFKDYSLHQLQFTSGDNDIAQPVQALKQLYGNNPFVFPTSSIQIMQGFVHLVQPIASTMSVVVGDMPIGDNGNIWRHSAENEYINLKWARLGSSAAALGLDFSILAECLRVLGLHEMDRPAEYESQIQSEMDESFQIRFFSTDPGFNRKLDQSVYRFIANDWDRYINLIQYIHSCPQTFEALLRICNFDFSFLKSVWWQPGMESLSDDTVDRCIEHAFAFGKAKWDNEVEMECAKFFFFRKHSPARALHYLTVNMVKSNEDALNVASACTLRKVSFLGFILHNILLDSNQTILSGADVDRYVSIYAAFRQHRLKSERYVPALRFWPRVIERRKLQDYSTN